VLDAIGWCLLGGFGAVPLTAQEVRAWCAGMQTALEPWEFEAVLKASRAYCRELVAEDTREPNFEQAQPPAPGSTVRGLAAALNKRKPKKPTP
jgi:hypothetical protein